MKPNVAKEVLAVLVFENMEKIPHIKHIFFDLDHTLWDFETNSKKTYEFIFNKNKIFINLDRFIETYSPINHHYWKLYRDEKVSKTQLKYARLKDTFKELNYRITDDLIHLLADEYLNNLSNYNTLFKGTIDLLEYLKDKYQLHIITNGFSEIQNAKLQNAKIASYFTHIITSEKVEVKKPNPKIFFYALKVSKANTYDSIMIGDNTEADIMGAKNIGLKTIHCNFTNNPSVKNTIVITRLSQIKNYL